MKKYWPPSRNVVLVFVALAVVAGFAIYKAFAQPGVRCRHEFGCQPVYRNNWKYWKLRIAAVESGGNKYGNYNLTIESGTGPSGKYQIANTTWLSYGGGKYGSRAKYATEAQQDEIAEKIFNAVGTWDWYWSTPKWKYGSKIIVGAPALPACARDDVPCSGNPSTPPPGGGSSGSCSTSSGDTSGSHPTISRSNPVSSTCVKHLQYILTDVATHRGSSVVNPKSCSSSGCDGGYGSNTEAAVRAYKVGKGLANSSTIDSATWSALHGSCAYMQKYPKNGADCKGSLSTGGSTGGGSPPPSGGSSSSCPTGGDSSGSHSTVKYGSNNTCVKHLQYILTQTYKWRVKMYGSSSVNPKETAGYFGSNTKTAVVNYQRGKGIEDDGIVGPITWGKLHESCKTINKYNFGGSKTYGIKC